MTSLTLRTLTSDDAGIGRALVGHLIAQARARGLRQISVTLTDCNARAARLYEASGFRLFGLEPDAFLLDGAYYGKQHRQLILSHHHHEQSLP